LVTSPVAKRHHSTIPLSPGALVATALLTAVLLLGQETKKWQDLRQKARFAGDFLLAIGDMNDDFNIL